MRRGYIGNDMLQIASPFLTWRRIGSDQQMVADRRLKSSTINISNNIMNREGVLCTTFQRIWMVAHIHPDMFREQTSRPRSTNFDAHTQVDNVSLPANFQPNRHRSSSLFSRSKMKKLTVLQLLRNGVT